MGRKDTKSNRQLIDAITDEVNAKAKVGAGLAYLIFLIAVSLLGPAAVVFAPPIPFWSLAGTVSLRFNDFPIYS